MTLTVTLQTTTLIIEYLLSPPFTHGTWFPGKSCITRNFRTLCENSTASNIFNKPPLKAFRRAKNLKEAAYLEHFQTNHQVFWNSLFCTCLLQPSQPYTGGHEGCCIECRPSQPVVPWEAGDEVTFLNIGLLVQVALIDQDLSFTWITHFSFAYSRACGNNV